ncbi:hypothetical protein T459_34694 [Capsicum annuum]|uniref:Uncharacterized protein n=1 Tax=Capsicum annuum TaxID=4072 RepID=A0A2G2XVF5_CAPAN|nr:hypothetical protein T459_34694 [Capsicum annuum]
MEFLKNFEKYNVSREVTDFEVEVKEVANTFEYTIQLTKTVLGENKSQKKKARQRFRRSLQQVVEDMDCIWEESTKIQDKGKRVSKEPLVRDFSSSTNDILNVNNNMVGRGDQNEHLLEDLIGSYTGEPKVIPIVGMGGIGKTTLAKEVYNHESILCRFDVRVWATVSQQHKIKKILLSLLQSMIKMDDTRYLIVLDDIWSCEAWDGVRGCFPTEDNTGSRILLTIRNNKVSCYAGTENLSMQMNFMDQDESWNLFKSASFSNEALSSEFETIGKEIADECHGLPITIVVVAGLLNSIREIEDWKSVAKDSSHFYNHLTRDLKTCLLHFGIFPEDSEIPVKNLMRSWMAEGFLNSEKDLEGEAEKCLQELVDRCLVLIIFSNQSLFISNYSKSWRSHMGLSNIQTISYLSLDCCTKEVILGVKNVKELGIRGNEIDSNGLLNNLVHLQQLETLSFIFCFKLLPASAKAFPATLKKLKLERIYISWSYLDIIAELPNLEVLKLMLNACDGIEWHPNVNGFTRLKVLLINKNYLAYWKSTNDNFPVLERLMIRRCYHLKEIHIEFAEIHTLQMIELTKCPPKLGECAA